LWRALTDTGTILNVHIGSSGRLAITAPDAPPDVLITLQPVNIVQAAADLLWSRVIKEFPDVRIALSEGGTGWIPYFMDRVDRTYEMHSTWTGQDFGDKKPSEVFRERFLTCFISDPVGIQLRDEIGVDNICWECDYPHSDSMWPDAPEGLWDDLTRYQVPDSDINKITHQNAMRWYHFDPFAHVPREQATVGALRAAAAGHDVSIKGRSHQIISPAEKVATYREKMVTGPPVAARRGGQPPGLLDADERLRLGDHRAGIAQLGSGQGLGLERAGGEAQPVLHWHRSTAQPPSQARLGAEVGGHVVAPQQQLAGRGLQGPAGDLADAGVGSVQVRRNRDRVQALAGGPPRLEHRCQVVGVRAQDPQRLQVTVFQREHVHVPPGHRLVEQPAAGEPHDLGRVPGDRRYPGLE
jgi:hypothetical protein